VPWEDPRWLTAQVYGFVSLIESVLAALLELLANSPETTYPFGLRRPSNLTVSDRSTWKGARWDVVFEVVPSGSRVFGKLCRP